MPARLVLGTYNNMNLYRRFVARNSTECRSPTICRGQERLNWEFWTPPSSNPGHARVRPTVMFPMWIGDETLETNYNLVSIWPAQKCSSIRGHVPCPMRLDNLPRQCAV